MPTSDFFAIPPAAAGRRVWLRVGTLLDGTSAAPLREADVVYDARSILHVGRDRQPPPAGLLASGQQDPDLDAPEATLLPGLIEAHAHLFLEGGELDPDRRAAYLRQEPARLLELARERWARLAGFGIAGIRDAGDKDGVGLALSRECASVGSSAGAGRPRPYLESPGAAIHHRGRYGGFMGEALEDWPNPAACVEARVRAGADRIKLIPTGIINFKAGAVTSQPQMTTAEVAALVAAAKSFGRQTFAHASGDKGIDRAIDGGVDSVEHGFFLRDDQLSKLRDGQIAWVPTFAPVQRQIDHAERMGWDGGVIANLRRVLDQHAATLVRAHERGVLIVAGSDAGSYGVAHGTGFLYELELMARAGLPAVAVINAATGTSSGRLRYRERIGRIAPGYRSRFILTRHSPLVKIANLRQARTVVFDDQVLPGGEAGDEAGL